MTTTALRQRDWTAHDSKIPFYDPRLAKLNGTNRKGRRPHALVDPERKPVYALLVADNDNGVPTKSGSVAA